MTRENTELAKAIERLSDVEAALRLGQGGIARDTAYAKRVSTDLRLILTARAAPLHEGEGEPVAWRVKDYADGWILFHHEAPARKSGEARNGALVQPLYAAPPPSVEVFGSSAEGADTYRVAETAVVEPTEAEVIAAASTMAVEWYCHSSESDESKAEAATQWKGFASMARTALIAARQRAAVSTAEQVGTSEASEPKPSVEVERLREALRDIDACSQHSFGFSDYSMRRRCGQIARAALSRKQEPGVPTPGGEGE